MKTIQYIVISSFVSSILLAPTSLSAAIVLYHSHPELQAFSRVDAGNQSDRWLDRDTNDSSQVTTSYTETISTSALVNFSSGDKYAYGTASGSASQSIDVLVSPPYASFDVSGSAESAAFTGTGQNYLYGDSQGTAQSVYRAYFYLDSQYQYSMESWINGGQFDHVTLMKNNSPFYEHIGQGSLYSEPKYSFGILEAGAYRINAASFCNARAFTGAENFGSCADSFSFSLQLTAVPVPPALLLLSSGLAVLAGIKSSRKKKVG